MNTASNWTEFSAALSQWCWPTQNVVYSDDQGHIAYHAVGRIPLRPGRHCRRSRSQDTAHEWQGYIPFDDMPNAFDPPSGFLATANSRVTSDKSKYPLTTEWADPYRAERIYKLLQGRDQLKPADMLAVADRHLQRDGPGAGPSSRLRHRSHRRTPTSACARPPT